MRWVWGILVNPKPAPSYQCDTMTSLECFLRYGSSFSRTYASLRSRLKNGPVVDRCRRTFCNRHCAEVVRLGADKCTPDPTGNKSRVCSACKEAYDAAMRGEADPQFMHNRIGKCENITVRYLLQLHHRPSLPVPWPRFLFGVKKPCAYLCVLCEEKRENTEIDNVMLCQ
jgi:hypothetical protein